MTRARMTALHYPGEDIDTVVRLVELHLRFHTYRLGWTDKAVRRYVRDAGPLLEQLNELTRCDCTTRNAAKAKALARRMDELERRIAELRERESLDAIRPDLDGTQVMARLGIPPSRQVGEALAFLLELRLDEGPLGEEEAGRRLDSGGRNGRPGAETAHRLAVGRRSQAGGRGQVGPGCPAAKSSTNWRAWSSWYCLGGDFMK